MCARKGVRFFPCMNDRTTKWLAIARVPEAVAMGAAARFRRGPFERGERIARAFEEPDSEADEEALVLGQQWPAIVRFARAQLSNAAREIEVAERLGARVVDIEDDEYPALLREIVDAPPVLFVRGRLMPADRRAIAVIGSRAATRYGIDVTRHLVPPLASVGITVVSGMARGIDAAAHRAALRAGGRTIAVLGTGIDVCYPLESRDLYDAIPERGAIVSESPPGTRAARWLFPVRNRIISGLAATVVVIEARSRSGTAVTARLAGTQGRSVGAVPGDIDLARSQGTNELLSQGAYPVRSAVDVVLNSFQELYGQVDVPLPEAPELDPASKAVMGALAPDALSVDALVARTRLPIGTLLGALSRLESVGLARRDEHGRYGRVARRESYG